MNYKNPYYFNPYYPYSIPNTSQYYGDFYRNKNLMEPDHANQYYLVPEALAYNLGSVPERPQDTLIQRETQCSGNELGQKLGGKSWDIAGVFGLEYTAYECQIQVTLNFLGLRDRRFTLKRGKTDFEWKEERLGQTHKIVGWMVGNALLVRYEMRAGGKVRVKGGPWTIATFPGIKFT